jgi:hypothetical protein
MSGDTERPSTAEISVVDPISRAIDWAGVVLFRPFDLGKWIALGFCAWLAMLGQGGGGGNGTSSWRDGGGNGDFKRDLNNAWEWVLGHLPLILFVAGSIIVVGIVLWLLVLWLSSRGKFMFLDGVIHNRGAVVEPWRRFRAPANALFRFRVVLGLICGAIVLTLLAFVGWLVWLGLDTDEITPLLIVGGGFGVLIFVAVMIAFSLIDLAVNEFVVPLMYLRNEGVAAAWRELGGLLSARPGPFVLYVLIKIVLAIGVAAIFIVSCCLTCCIVLLPFVGTVILLPLWVFLRAFPLYFLGQFGPRYDCFERCRA